MTNNKKYVYFFGYNNTDGEGWMRDLLGGKGAGLADMTKAGVPVPPGFTITTDVCRYYYENSKTLPCSLNTQMTAAILKLEDITTKKFGNPQNPLLLSVRSGARVSMPGMMDTILNLGLNDEVVEGLAKLMKNEWFAYDSYRRFIMMFSDVVLGISKDIFEKKFEEMKTNLNVKNDTDVDSANLKKLTNIFKNIVKDKQGQAFPQNTLTQLYMAKDAVLNSWNTTRAITYRKLNKIPEDIGTAVNVQAMVFGNMGNDCATGVGFTRNPSTGNKEFYGEYLINAQGEDVVAGVRTPYPIADLKTDMPEVFDKLKQITSSLENHYKDVQDFEFTVEKNNLYMLQTRSGKRTAKATIKIAVDMVNENLITKKEALLRVDAASLDQLLHPIIDPQEKISILANGLPASPGAVSGKVVFTSDDAVKARVNDEDSILVRLETCPDDIHGMDAAKGILTVRGGMTSHAAVVARGMGKCCVAGCDAISINSENETFTVGKVTIKKGEIITLDGATGNVIATAVKTVEPELSGEFATFMEWADEVRTLQVRANADIPKDAIVAKNFGAEGIGLCRTEHMFFEEDRIPIVQEMILANDLETRQACLDKLMPLQKKDFYGLFKEMNGYAVTIRLMDPPLHEFLPKREELMLEIAIGRTKNDDVTAKEIILKRVEELHEFNPMLGHRGCRLGITYPEITKMQAIALFSAACELIKEGKDIVPEVMIPLVGNVNELKNQKNIIDKVAHAVRKEYAVEMNYLVGTMIEVPRATITADKLAEVAEFFSFGTNDLTQMTYGFSRDDAAKFINHYIDKKIMNFDPFQTIDQDGVGQLIELATKKGKSIRSNIKLGICGEHGGDPESVKLCYRIGLDYVSCSPYRLPIARLAAAQAKLESK
ncbi:MAG: pyruvate, phosphate dikinase [bacterium]|nr:pyruvate, phosphate dikinase [bacterium]